jgi:hypothetical protein
MRFRAVFEAALAIGAIVAVVGGVAIAALHVVDSSMPILRQVESGYRHAIFGFLFLTLFAVGSALIGALSQAEGPAPEKEPAPLPAAAALPAAPPPPEPARSGLDARYHEMKTFIDLEMWELALEKANAILKDHPGTREAELVQKNLAELRWKAEPKFVSMKEPLSAVQEKELRDKGLAQMYQHVRTYMDLEMWELARQKAITILRNFPDAPESIELMKVFDTIEKKARETAEVSRSES